MSDLSEGLTAAPADRYAIGRAVGRGSIVTVCPAAHRRGRRPVRVTLVTEGSAIALLPTTARVGWRAGDSR